MLHSLLAREACFSCWEDGATLRADTSLVAQFSSFVILSSVAEILNHAFTRYLSSIVYPTAQLLSCAPDHLGRSPSSRMMYPFIILPHSKYFEIVSLDPDSLAVTDWW